MSDGPGTWDFSMFVSEDGLHGTVAYDVQYEDVSARLEHGQARRIVFPFRSSTAEHVHPTLLPLDAELARLRGLETGVRRALEAAGIRHVKAGHRIHAGTYELLIQLADATGFDAAVERWKDQGDAEVPEWRAKTSTLASTGWGSFEERYVPKGASRYWSTNAEVIAELGRAGLDTSRPQPIEHHFTGDESSLREVGRRAVNTIEQVAITVDPGAPTEGNLAARMTITAVVDLLPAVTSAMEAELRALADAVGATYEGWGERTKKREGRTHRRGRAPGRAGASSRTRQDDHRRARARWVRQREHLASGRMARFARVPQAPRRGRHFPVRRSHLGRGLPR